MPDAELLASSRTRVLRVIARMNMGGPAHHVALLGEGLQARGYDTLLACGEVGTGEQELVDAVRRLGPGVHRVAGLGPRPSAGADVVALRELTRLVRRWRPDVVHTHTAKGGFLGRLAAHLAGRPRPVVVHTYHGHVLEGYFSPPVSAAFRGLERLAAHGTDALIGVSETTVADLVRLRVAPRSRFRVVPLGLDLDPFLALDRTGPSAGRLRAETGAGSDEVVALFVGRFAPIKRLDVLLDALAAARAAGAPVRLAVVGDGEQRPELEARAAGLGLERAVTFAGYREDVLDAIGSADIAVLSSDNEGTPVSLIQAAAGGLPLASTDVGGVAEVVRPGLGLLSPARDAAALGRSLATLAADAGLRRAMGERARAHVRDRYAAARLVEDIDELYRELLARRARPRD